MSTIDENTNAQVPATGTDSSQAAPAVPAPQPGQGANPSDGVQKRIDELTAMVYEQKAIAAAAQRQSQELMQTLTQRAYEQAPQAPAPSFENVDPDVRKAVEHQLAQQRAHYERQNAQILAQTADVQLRAVLQGQDPRVAGRTQEIWRDAVSKNAHVNGYTPEHALRYALGELAPTLLAEAQRGQVVRQGQDFNRAGQSQVIAGQVPPPAPVSTRQGEPPDMEEDPEAAADYYRQRLGDKTF